MRIYQVSGYDSGGTTNYYEPTKKAALARIAEMKANATDTDAWDDVEIIPLEIKPTREGMAAALQNVIDMLCSNEH